jgi:Sulfatase
MAGLAAVLAVGMAAVVTAGPASAQDKKPNIVMLMTDDTGWGDFGAYAGGGKALGHPTPSIDRVAKEGATFTSWYGQSKLHGGSCLVHHRSHPDPHGTVRCRGSG